MLSIYADVFRIATFQDSRRREAEERRARKRAERDLERLAGQLGPRLRRDVGLE
jgi:hypothetical protein